MTEPDLDHPQSSGSFWHRRRPGLRYIYSAAAIAGGLILIVRFAAAFSAGESSQSWSLVIGIVLIVIGGASITLYRWMDKRSL